MKKTNIDQSNVTAIPLGMAWIYPKEIKNHLLIASLFQIYKAESVHKNVISLQLNLSSEGPIPAPISG